MNIHTTKQSGFGLVAIIVAILVVLGLGYVGYRVYTAQTNKPAGTNNTITDQTSNNTQNSNTQTDPNAGYVVIKEWDVRFKPVSGLSGVEYALRNSSTSVIFSTQQLTTSDAHCSAENSGYPGIGSIARTATGSTAPFGGTLLATISDYDYYYEGAGQSSCITDPNNTTGTTLLQKTDQQFSDSVKSLEAAK